MGERRTPQPVKLISSIFGANEERLLQAESLLVHEFGALHYRSSLLPFIHTDYYAAEFGAPLVRVIVAFERLVDPGMLPAIKCRTNEMERDDSTRRHRWVNIDPGYVSLSKLVLATTKDHAHRIYLGHGIYAEVTLHFREGGFCPWPWTYPDYGSAPYIDIFNCIRTQYHRQLRAGQAPT